MQSNLLAQYLDLLEEKKDIQKRILKVESDIRKIERGDSTVSDVVTCGKRGKKSLGHRKIEGAPVGEYVRKRIRLNNYKNKLKESEEKIESLIEEVEEFIKGVDDSRIRRILRYKYIDRLTWRDVANRMGGLHTEESCRKAVQRYLESLSDMS